MTAQTWIEIVGYIGSLLVLVSFLMTSVFKLRIVNTIGSVIFMTYALIIRSYPTAFMNFCLVAINLRFLWKMTHTRKDFELVRVEPGDGYLKHFVNTYMEDIAACFPGIKVDLSKVNRAYFVNCENKPVAVFTGLEENGTVDIQLDYSTPEYRDFSIGTYLLEKLPAEGIRALTYSGPTENHTAYLAKMGFTQENGVYKRTL